MSLGASAQQRELLPSPAVNCLTPGEDARGTPEYPAKAYERGEAGRVKVALDFNSATGRPAVEVLEQAGDSDFVDAVQAHVRAYRVPCLQSGQTARLTFEFVFVPDNGKVFFEPPTDATDAERRRMMACLRQAEGDKSPDYSELSRRASKQGRIMALLTFHAPDQPPTVTLLHRPNAKMLARSVADWLESIRMPCQQGMPVSIRLNFAFTFEGDAYGFKPLSLLQLLSNVKGIDEQTVTFDTRTMGCPFDLRLTYLQPLADNVVGQVGGFDPSRAPLLQWLRQVQLNLPAASLDAVYADTANVTVPCLDLRLTPSKP